VFWFSIQLIADTT